MYFVLRKKRNLSRIVRNVQIKTSYETPANICSCGKFRKQEQIIPKREADFPYVINDWTEIYLDLSNLFYYKIARK